MPCPSNYQVVNSSAWRLARSLVYRPALLLADEPTGNLDKRSSRETVDLLKMANRQFHQTTLVITHDDEVALEVIASSRSKMVASSQMSAGDRHEEQPDDGFHPR